MNAEQLLLLISELFSSETLLRISLFLILLFGLRLAWRLQKTINNGVDFAEFIRDPKSHKFTTERLGHFVALWVTTVAFCFLMTVESVNKIELFLTYGGLWVTSRALDRFAARNDTTPPPPQTIDVQTPAGKVTIAGQPVQPEKSE